MTEPTRGFISEAARLLGAGGDIPAELETWIREAYQKLKDASTPRGVWGFFDIEAGADHVDFNAGFRIEGRDLAGILRGCSRAVLVAATLGQQVDKLINRLQATSMSEAVVLDACASVEAELYCDEVENEAMRSLGGGEYLTMRYSPGYGDVPLAESAKILSALGAMGKIGLTATESGMLLPIKSITAVIGVANERRDRKRDCSLCGSSGSCPYKKRGDHCGV